MNQHENLILGCLFHDVGKFFERAEMLAEYRNDDDKRQQYCKWNDQGKYFSHIHVLHTLAFCEQLTDLVSLLKPKEKQQQNDADQNWINLASYHHNPSMQRDAYLEQIVQAADRLASAEREQGDFYERGIHQKTRMEALLGRVDLTQSDRVNDCFLPLSEINLSEESIFPRKAASFGMAEKQKEGNKGWISEQKLTGEYRDLGERFLTDLKKLQTFQAGVDNRKMFASVLRSLLSLMEHTLSQAPAATNVTHPDISLFDHLRVTAAIGEGMLFQRQQQQESSVEISSDKKAKWNLVCGDFSGIQKFIYKITSKGAAKGLRGRSLFIQLLCDAVSEQLLRKLGLQMTARIYSSGGKFYLLIPTHFSEAIRREADHVNADLLRKFQGEVYLGLGLADVFDYDFAGGKMGRCWKAANEDLQRNRVQPFWMQATSDSDFFAPQEQYPSQSCQVCGRDDLEADLNKEGICGQCIDLQKIGQALAKAEYLFWAWNEDRRTAEAKLRNTIEKIALPGADCTLYFLEQPPQFSELTDLSDSHLEAINHWRGFSPNPQGYSQGIRYIGKWMNEKDSGGWEFDHFSGQAEGVKRLGVLRMDVDNLGQVFIRGLRFNNQEMGSLSRVATLSRQLHLFFAGYLHKVLQEYQRCQIIYAGGDDVFIIGSWDELPAVAEKINSEFKRYCANNPDFTLSGGIVSVGGKYPISRAAGLAGDAEEKAKELKRGNSEKDALCFLDAVIGWESYSDAVELRRLIEEVCETTDSNAMIERLRQVVLAVDEFKRRNHVRTEREIQEMIQWDKWRWRLVYNLKRMAKRYKEVEPQILEIQQRLLDSEKSANEQQTLDWLQLPVRWAEFNRRRE